MSSDRARQLLSRLAGEQPTETPDRTAAVATDYGRIIEEATAALEDLDAAAAFAEDDGIERLEAAVDRAESDLSERATTGRETLAAYHAFRDAAEGSVPSNAGYANESPLDERVD